MNCVSREAYCSFCTKHSIEKQDDYYAEALNDVGNNVSDIYDHVYAQHEEDFKVMAAVDAQSNHNFSVY